MNVKTIVLSEFNVPKICDLVKKTYKNAKKFPNLSINSFELTIKLIMIFYKLFFCAIFWATLVLSKPILNQEFIKSRNYEPKKNIFDVTLKRITLAPDGFTRSLATINGQYPGPVIEANKGDRIVLNIRNELGEPTCKLQKRFFLVRLSNNFLLTNKYLQQFIHMECSKEGLLGM